VSDFLLQADLKGCGFWLFRRCFQKCQVLLPLSVYEMYYSLHYKLFVPIPARGQNTVTQHARRAGRPHEVLGG
jgi:hypothetical protein